MVRAEVLYSVRKFYHSSVATILDGFDKRRYINRVLGIESSSHIDCRFWALRACLSSWVSCCLLKGNELFSSLSSYFPPFLFDGIRYRCILRTATEER